jgi:hypothetical protein
VSQPNDLTTGQIDALEYSISENRKAIEMLVRDIRREHLAGEDHMSLIREVVKHQYDQAEIVRTLIDRIDQAERKIECLL